MLGEKGPILLLTLEGKLMSSLPRLARLTSLPPHAFLTSPAVDGELCLSTLLSQMKSVAAGGNASRSRTESDSDAIALLPVLLSDGEKSWAGMINPSWTHSPTVGFS